MNINDFRVIEPLNRTNLLRKSLSLSSSTGWFMEFGTYKGYSINMMANWYPDQTFYGFDSLVGLPEAWERSDTSTYDKGHFQTPKPHFNHNVDFVFGYFHESLPSWLEENAKDDSFVSFLHIDSDLYSSAKTVLTLLNDYINTGTVIVFDELCDWQDSGIYPKWKDGEWKALCEWIEEYDRSYEIIGRGIQYEAAIQVK